VNSSLQGFAEVCGASDSGMDLFNSLPVEQVCAKMGTPQERRESGEQGRGGEE